MNFLRAILRFVVGMLPSAPLDASFGMSERDAVHKALMAKDYGQILRTYGQLSAPARSLLIKGVVERGRSSRVLMRWHMEEPEDLLALLFAGSHYVWLAWQARGGSSARDLESGEVFGFWEWLTKAQETLQAALDISDQEPELYPALIQVAMGQNDPSLAASWFRALMELDAGHLHGYMAYLQVQSPQWLGSEGEMAALGEEARDVSRRGYPHLLTIYLMSLVGVFQEMQAEQADRERTQRYFSRDFREELVSLQQEVAATAKHPQMVYAHNYLAFLFEIMGDRSHRDQALEAMGGYVSREPWRHIGVDSSLDLWIVKVFGWR